MSPEAMALPPPIPTRNVVRMMPNPYTDEPLVIASARDQTTS